jgi:hypothetical protein
MNNPYKGGGSAEVPRPHPLLKVLQPMAILVMNYALEFTSKFTDTTLSCSRVRGNFEVDGG